ncbi:Phage tail protein [Pseudomonas chlororaphis]|uniref:phage tail assembly chaperone n=1 Tax=Pseudomonas chlororaphis TaxID=587753 RepID=UPI0039E103CB
MTVFFSPSTGFFYDDQVCESIPHDVIEFSATERDALLSAQGHGRYVGILPDGRPGLIDSPPQSPEQLAEVERFWRFRQLSTTDGVVTRHRDELEDGVTTTLTPEQYTELQAYRRALRDWPENGEFPLAEHRPVAPPWLADELQ